jgi:predicted nucleic acid-binding protein
LTYLLDSSAWLAHLFGEPGVEEVGALFDDPDSRVAISALSIPEVYTRLKAIGKAEKWAEVWESYSELFSGVISADEAIAHRAILLRTSSPNRLPTIDGLIAATALNEHLTLVHRDPHLSTVNDPDFRQMLLPDK